MSESAEVLVVVDPLDDDEAGRLGAGLTGWLVEHGLVVRSGEDLAPGPAAPAAVGAGWGTDSTAWAPVTVHTGWDVHWSGEAYDEPSCPRCRTQLPGDVFLPALGRWAESRDEPTLTCPACGFGAPLADWPVGDAGAAGPVAVEFTNWPPLTAAWAGLLRERAGRSVSVHAHF